MLTPEFNKLLDLYEEFHGETLITVEGEANPSKVKNGALNFDRVEFIFSDKILILLVNINTDEIIISRKNRSESANSSSACVHPIFKELIGKELGWAWFARNSNGYADMAILSFDGICPQWAFVGEASSISVYRMDQVLQN